MLNRTFYYKQKKNPQADLTGSKTGTVKTKVLIIFYYKKKTYSIKVG
jgi:hypothetical protein